MATRPLVRKSGTIIIEPVDDQQVDSLQKLEFLPGAISALRKIAESGRYKLVMVTNQDGLGTGSFPEDTFWPAHNKMLKILKDEGIQFSEILIDRSFPHENSPNRKPDVGMLKDYLNGKCDLANSYVIGDRITDLQLAKNMGCNGIYFNQEQDQLAGFTSTDWHAIVQYLLFPAREVFINRNTNETKISVQLNLDGSGKAQIATGLGFFDHMLHQIAKHSACDLTISVDGDLHVDEHHTIEDTALALGEAFSKALGDKRGINRYGFLLPMDDSLAQVALDFGGRPWLVWQAKFKREKVGDMPTEMFYHFFKSFSDASKSNLNIKAEGENEHHKIEAIFKAIAKCIKMAVQRNELAMDDLPSTKGFL